jgi:alcohol dehydrogenase class IV
MGRRSLVVTRRSADPERLGIAGEPFPIHGEPSVDLIRRGTQLAREAGCDLVIAMGGGSAIDAGKAIAAILGNGGDPLDYLEVVGHGQPLTRPAAPFIAIPTTAGTGAEVTRNAVLASPEHHVKASLRSPQMLPALAVVDPELTLDLPPALTATTGLDALTQLIEPYVSNRANAMTDLYCAEGLRLAATALRRAWRDGAPGATATIWPPARAWHSPACWEAWRWPTPGWARCMDSPRRWEACSMRPMARYAPRCCRMPCW